MDKQTLSNYGWIVIAVLVLVVMIALAGPFGNFVADAVKSTTQGLFDVNKNALNAAGVPGLTVQDQEFDVPDMNHGAETPVPAVPGATFTDGTFLTWEELKLDENGTKYGYDASAINDTTIGDYAFYDCDSLASIDLPESLTTIGDSAFAICISLTSITFGENSQLTTIGDFAFDSCNFVSIDLPDSITSIGEHTFQRCGSLTSIDLPDSITSIGTWTFYDCDSLASIEIPDSATSIGEEVFGYCHSLENITFKGTTAQWNAITFGDSWNLNVPATYVQCSDGQLSLS